MKSFSDRYTILNEAQKRAVDLVEGSVLVVAGPGSGKTEILTLRVANILKQTDAEPGEILCLTFTESAAATMRARLIELIGSDAYHIPIFTFHGFAAHIAERHPLFFHGGAQLVPASNVIQQEILAEVLTDLPLDNPLRSEHPSQGFIYLRDIRSRISDLKRAGITPKQLHEVLRHNKKRIEAITKLLEPFNARIALKNLESYRETAETLLAKKEATFPLPFFGPLSHALGQSLLLAVIQAEETQSSKPLSSWKTQYTKPGVDKKRTLKEGDQEEKLFALVVIYKQYQKTLAAAGYRDFDDLLLDALETIQGNPGLQAELHEQYQYILVDEFQDTNGAQAQFLSLLTDHKDRNPNLMVVGDDDQAIYKFQGAALDNILGFKERYPGATIITMTTSYRSHQRVLDLARSVIKQGQQRLEDLIPELNKTLSAGKSIEDGVLGTFRARSREEERQWIVEQIQTLIDEGIHYEEIAIIGRYHKDLQEIMPYINRAEIPLRYDRQRDVRNDPHIKELITLARFITALAEEKPRKADYLLPEILAFSFWGLSRMTIWEISLEAAKNRTSWLEVMREHRNEQVKAVATFLIELSIAARTYSAELMLDVLVGSTKMPESEHDFISPFKEHYFGNTARKDNPMEYHVFLGGLKAFMSAFREYRGGAPAHLRELVTFTDLHEEHNEPILAPDALSGVIGAVHLLTAHQAKGMEFQAVFILHASEDVWARGSRGSKITFPRNLPITPAGDTRDDQLRLFYVAITRAERILYLSSSPSEKRGSDALLGFLPTDLPKNENTVEVPQTETLAWEESQTPLIKDEKQLLAPFLHRYQLNPTHLNTFLDIVNAGPETFFEHHILQFPRAESLASKYGSAVHATIEKLYRSFQETDKLPTQKSFLTLFQEEINRRDFPQGDKERYLVRGEKALKVFYKERKKTFQKDDIVENNFRSEHLLLDETPITGKIDVIREYKKGKIEIIDFKTGKPKHDWGEKNGWVEIQLHNYKRQLLFYALVLQSSLRFQGKEITRGRLSYVEPDKKTGEIVDLVLEFEEHELERVKALAKAIYEKAQALDFPDISQYPQTLKGIELFEKDILEGKK